MSSVSNQQDEKVLISIRVDRDVYEKVKEYAKTTDNTVSRLVRQFFQHLIEEAEKPPESSVESL